MKKEITPLTMVISAVVVIGLIVLIFFLVDMNKSNPENVGNGTRSQGMQALQKLNTQGSGSATTGATSGLNAMKNLAPNGYSGATTVGK